MSLSLLLALLAGGAGAKSVRVNASAPGPVYDGASWTTAFRTIQEGVNVSGAQDEVWVAAGTYAENVTMAPGVALYGGFSGIETARDQRDPVANPAKIIPSAGAAVTVPATLVQTAVLDGFTISAGSPGVSCTSGSVVIHGNTITGCQGGIAFHGLDNTAMVSGNTIQGSSTGGAIACEDGTFTITGNVLTGNAGGGVNVTPTAASTTVLIARNVIRNNASGSGVRCSSYGSVVIASNLIAGNASGGVTAASQSGSANAAGPNLWVRVLGNTLTANKSSAVYIRGDGYWPLLADIAGNVIAANTTGISLYLFATDFQRGRSGLIIRNNDVYGNTQSNYSGLVSLAGLDGNIQADPLFVSAAQGDYHPGPGSPCRDAGDPSIAFASPLDLDGRPRIQGGRPDMGAYEASSEVATGEASGVTSAGATLNGEVTAPDASTTVAFEWGLTTGYGATTPSQAVPLGQPTALSSALSGLAPGTSYHYRLVAATTGGTVAGPDATFTTRASVWGTALDLDGSTGYLQLPPAVYAAGDFTIEAWVRPRAYGAFTQLLDLGNGPWRDNITGILNSYQEGYPALSVIPGNSETKFTTRYRLSRNRWCHLAYVLEGTTARIYVDGMPVSGSLNAAGPMPQPLDVVRSRCFLGRSHYFQDTFLDGTVDDLAIWSIARTAEQVQQDMGAPLSGSEPGLVAYYPFDEGAGIVAHDATGHGYDARLTYGAAWAASAAGSGPPFTWPDVERTLSLASGLAESRPTDIPDLDIVYDYLGPRLNLLDAVRIARKVAGLEPNP